MWFVDALAPIRDNPHSGFILAIVAFPLLERYLREKSSIGERDLNAGFFASLEVVFPEIKSQGRDFYAAYRNGLLHQAAFSLEKTKGKIRALAKAGFSGYDLRPVYFEPSDGWFYLNPREFYGRVVDTILDDFKTYEGNLSVKHPLPQHLYASTINPLTTVTIGITGSK